MLHFEFESALDKKRWCYYLYSREAQDLKSNATALVRKYHETAEENIKEAAAHRLMAIEQAQHDSIGGDGKMATAVEEESQGSN